MAKWLDSRTAPSAEVVSPIDTIIMGGLADRCVADSARKPAGPSAPLAVTMATPIARQPIAFQKVFASISLSMPLLLYCPVSISEKSAELRYANVATASRKRLQSPQQRGDEDLASLTLFHGWRSSASRRVRLCLAEKGLAFDSRVIDLVKGEHHSPEFLRLNPNGVIPLLILEDGRALYESGTICEYVDETWPEPPLRPADAYGRAEMRNWIRHVDGLIGNLIIFNWVHGMAQVAQKWTDAELAERLAGARPLFDGGHRGRAVRQTPRRGDRPRRDDPRAPSQSLGLVGGD